MEPDRPALSAGGPSARSPTPTIQISNPASWDPPCRRPSLSHLRNRLSTDMAAMRVGAEEDHPRTPSPTAFVFPPTEDCRTRTTMHDYVLTSKVRVASKTYDALPDVSDWIDGEVRFFHRQDCGGTVLLRWRGNESRSGHNWYLQKTEDLDDSSWCPHGIDLSRCTIEQRQNAPDLFSDDVWAETLHDLQTPKWSEMQEDDLPSPRSDLSRRSSVGRSPARSQGIRRRRSTRSNRSNHAFDSRSSRGHATSPGESFWDIKARVEGMIEAEREAAEHADDDRQQYHSSSPSTSLSSPTTYSQPGGTSPMGVLPGPGAMLTEIGSGFTLDLPIDANNEGAIDADNERGGDGRPSLHFNITTAGETSPATDSDSYSGDPGYGVHVGEETTDSEESI